MSTSFFGDLVNELNEDLIMADSGKGSAESAGIIDTGSYALNGLMSASIFGGAYDNKVTAFAGPEATGKTFFVMGIMQNWMKKYPNGGVIFNDTESAVTNKMRAQRGIDNSRVVIAEPVSVQKFRHNCIQILDRYIALPVDQRPPMFMVLDSLGQLSTTKELEDTAEGKETKDMTRAQVIKATFRVLNLKLAQARVPMFVTNHVYDAVGTYTPQKVLSGGSGLKYTASQIFFLSKKKDRDDSKEVVGNIITVRSEKNRMAREQKTVDVKLSYDKGLDRYYGLLPVAVKHGVFVQTSRKYELPDGRKFFENEILRNPEEVYTEEILKLVDEAFRKEFSYGEGEVPSQVDEA